MVHKRKYCDTCSAFLDEFHYYPTNNLEKYPDGRLNTCKKCVGAKINNWNPETFLPILKEIDVPYIKEEWDIILEHACKKIPSNITGTTVIGKYIAKMLLCSWKNWRWKDSPHLQEKEIKS